MVFHLLAHQTCQVTCEMGDSPNSLFLCRFVSVWVCFATHKYKAVLLWPKCLRGLLRILPIIHYKLTLHTI